MTFVNPESRHKLKVLHEIRRSSPPHYPSAHKSTGIEPRRRSSLLPPPFCSQLAQLPSNMSRQSMRSRGNSIDTISSGIALSVSSSGFQSGSRTASRGGSRGTSRRRKRNQVPNSHIPVSFLLGNKNKGYFDEIPNFPQAQPLHHSFTGAVGPLIYLESDRLAGTSASSNAADAMSQSSLSYEAGKQPLVKHGLSKFSDPILSDALSRAEKERLAAEVLMGHRSLLPSRDPNTTNGWGNPMKARPKSNPSALGSPTMSPPRHQVGQAISQNLPYALEWGSRPR